MNVYPKNQSVTFTGYLEALQEAVGSQNVTVADYCHETRRVQLDIGELDFDAFKEDLKGKLAAFDLLIWPERIYSTNTATATAANTPQALGSWHLDAVKAREVLARGQGSQAVTIAVIDSGFDTDHPGIEPRHHLHLPCGEKGSRRVRQSQHHPWHPRGRVGHF